MEDNSAAVSNAAIAVINTLQPLDQHERAHVLNAAFALFGLSAPQTKQGTAPHVTAPPPLGTQAVVQTSAQTGGKPISIGEFVASKEPATNSQRIACFAYYREKFEGNEHFSKADLLPYFASAKIRKPGNYDRDYKDSVRENWIHDENDKSYLTTTGEKAVEAGFGGKGKPRGNSVKRRKPGSKASD